MKQKCSDKFCPIHGNLSTRGRSFKGRVIKKLPKRITILFEGIEYVKKYERYEKKRAKIHARLPDCMEDEINVGDYVEVKETRPISKIISCVLIKKIQEEK